MESWIVTNHKLKGAVLKSRILMTLMAALESCKTGAGKDLEISATTPFTGERHVHWFPSKDGNEKGDPSRTPGVAHAVLSPEGMGVIPEDKCPSPHGWTVS